MSARHVTTLDAPATPDEVAATLPRLAAALDGSGPPLLFLTDRPVNVRTAVLDVVSRTPVPDDTALLVATSGTTGPPRLAMLSRVALHSAASGSAELLGGRGTYALALPTSYVAGAMVLVRCVLSGHEPAVVDPTDGFSLRSFVDAVDAVLHQPHDDLRLTSLVPTQLARLLDAGGATTAALVALDAVLLGGAAAPATLVQRARDTDINVVTTYGMTETCGGCVYDGVPMPEVGVRIVDDRVELAGPVLFDGYLGDEAATAEVWHDGWFRTHDRGRVVDGRLQVLGRSDDVIQSGGVNVSLSAVEHALTELAGIDDAAVVALPDDEWGTELVAVLASSRPVDLDAVRAAVTERLGRASAPRRLLVLPNLPRLTSGKPDRQALRTLVAHHRAGG
jgi:O-succinylbenzoic acid--CoA ligase